MKRHNVTRFNIAREIDDKIRMRFERRIYPTESLIKRLTCVQELQGHNGCVNCLEWDSSGRIILSGSDDTIISLWKPPHPKPYSIPSGHSGNIFSVKFLSPTSVISSSGDGHIKIHSLPRATSRVQKPDEMHDLPGGSGECLLDCSCHRGRVKRLAVHGDVYWSVGEDGWVGEWDVRERHICRDVGRDGSCKHVLIALAGQGKCIAVNERRPEYIAVGINDGYVRLYDRRKISRNKSPSSSCQYFIPSNLRDVERHSLSCTYVTFSPDGNKLLANMEREQIYLFNIINPNRKRYFEHPTKPETEEKDGFIEGVDRKRRKNKKSLKKSSKRTKKDKTTKKSKNDCQEDKLSDSGDKISSNQCEDVINRSNNSTKSDKSQNKESCKKIEEKNNEEITVQEMESDKLKGNFKQNEVDIQMLVIPKLVRDMHDTKSREFSRNPLKSLSKFDVSKNQVDEENVQKQVSDSKDLKMNNVGEIGINQDTKEKSLSTNTESQDNFKKSNPNPIRASQKTPSHFPPAVSELLYIARSHVSKGRYSQAIAKYSEALQLCDDSLLLNERGACFYQRGWASDKYEALRDCWEAIKKGGGDEVWKKALESLKGKKKKKGKEKVDKKKNNLKQRFRCRNRKHVKGKSKRNGSETKDENKKEKLKKKKSRSEGEEEDCGDSDYGESDATHEELRDFLIWDSSDTEELGERSDNYSDATDDMDSDEMYGESESDFDGNLLRRARILQGSFGSEIMSVDTETRLNSMVGDYEKRYCGRCNIKTDIKEANFWGSDGSYIIAGSDGGYIFMWETSSCNVVGIWHGDTVIVNVVQPSPLYGTIGTSGIDHVLRLWNVSNEENGSCVSDIWQTMNLCVEMANYESEQIENFLINVSYRLTEDENNYGRVNTLQCRTS